MELFAFLFLMFLPVLPLTLAVEAALRFFPERRFFVLYFLPVAAAMGATGIVVWMMSQRVGYAYELEWIEGGVLQQVVRIIEGYAPYAMPTFEYVPALYAPLYYYLSAGMTFILGVGLPALRAVSVLASVVTSLLIAFSVWHLTRSRLAAVLGFFSFGAMYHFSFQWFDVARVDSVWTMCLALTVAILVRCQAVGCWRSLPFAAASFAMAVLSKQSSLFVAFFLFLALWSWRGLYDAFVFSVISAFVVVFFSVLMQIHSDGWFFYFTLQMAPHHGMKGDFLGAFLFLDIIGNVLFIAVFALSFVFLVSSDIRVRLGWISLLFGFGVMAFVSRKYSGGESNVLMPLFMLLSMMAVSGFALIVGRYESGLRYRYVGFLSVLLAFNFYHGWVKDASEYHVPARRAGGDDAIGDALVKRISQVPGRVCVTMHGYLGYMAGKGFCSHRLLLHDVMMAGDTELIESIQAEAREKIMSGHYQVIIVDGPAEITDLGLQLNDIPYTMTLLESSPDYPRHEFYPIVSGTKPMYWLEYNGKGFLDDSGRKVSDGSM